MLAGRLLIAHQWPPWVTNPRESFTPRCLLNQKNLPTTEFQT